MLTFLCCVYRVCETGPDTQPLSDNRQTTCEHFVDSLFEEAQKVGARFLSPTEQKKQVKAYDFFFSFSPHMDLLQGPWDQNCVITTVRCYLPGHRVDLALILQNRWWVVKLPAP